MLSEKSLNKLAKTLTLKMSNGASLRLYPDSRPHNLAISDLQKGLILMLGGEELIEEGAGFGSPAVKYEDRVFFSGTAETFVYEKGENAVLSKSFQINMVEKMQIGKGPFINDHVYTDLDKTFNKIFVERKTFRPITYKLMNLMNAAGMQTRFVKAESKGTIKFTYTCFSDFIRIDVNLSNLDKRGCREIIILNEQGSTFFQKYFDSNNLELYGKEIGAWEKVDAGEASFSDVKGKLKFILQKANEATLFRGSEQLKGVLSWVGLNYVLNPKLSAFTYEIRLR